MNIICQTNGRWVGVVACLVALFTSTSVYPQQAKKPLLVEHVCPSVLTESPAPTNFDAGGIVGSGEGEAATRAMKKPKRELTRGERWEKFETEFGVRKKDPSLIKGSLESAKYQLDKTTFAVNEFVQHVEDTFSFDYELRNLGRGDSTNESTRATSSSPIPLWKAVENARFKSDIDLDVPGGRAFVGVRLVLPIGD